MAISSERREPTRRQGDRTLEILFDARWIGNHGIGRFAKEMVSRLGIFLPWRSRLSPTSPFDALFLSLRVLLGSIGENSCWYSPGYNAPLFFASRYVITLHDLNHIDVSFNSSFLKRLYYALVVKRACRRSALVVTVSEFSKQRIVEWAQVAPSKVVNVGNGVSSVFFDSSVAPFVPGFPYFLVVGNRKRHKNETAALEALAVCDLPADVKIVFSGSPSSELLALATDLCVSDRVVFTGPLSEVELAAAYKGAIALVFPSLYEGFGLPVIESMASGTPVITSGVTALPEVAGGAALLVDPHDPRQIATAMERCATDGDLRLTLSEQGRARARQFSWEAVAQRLERAVVSSLQRPRGE